MEPIHFFWGMAGMGALPTIIPDGYDGWMAGNSKRRLLALDISSTYCLFDRLSRISVSTSYYWRLFALFSKSFHKSMQVSPTPDMAGFIGGSGSDLRRSPRTQDLQMVQDTTIHHKSQEILHQELE